MREGLHGHALARGGLKKPSRVQKALEDAWPRRHSEGILLEGLPGRRYGLLRCLAFHMAVYHRVLFTNLTPIQLSQISSKLSQNQKKTAKTHHTLTF